MQKAHAASPQLCFEHYFASQQNVDMPQTCVCTRQAQYASRCVFSPFSPTSSEIGLTGSILVATGDARKSCLLNLGASSNCHSQQAICCYPLRWKSRTMCSITCSSSDRLLT